jgi:hypothetical protein
VQEHLRVVLEAPEAGQRLAGGEARVFVSGRILLGAATATGAYDAMLVIDTSSSTGVPSGADVDEDRQTGRAAPWPLRLVAPGSDDEGDHVLAAEVAAARTLLAQLDPETTRLGVIGFSGSGDDDAPDARLLVPLTARFDLVDAALEQLLRDGPSGRTNIFEAVVLGAAELAGVEGALSEPRPSARKVMLLMTDGQPTLPGPRTRSRRLAIEAARAASELGIRCDTFAIGTEATSDPRVTQEIAEVSGGEFTAVEDPRGLVAAFREVRLAKVQRLQVRNATTGARAEYAQLDADGAFSALVPLREGFNAIEIRATANNGLEARAGVPVHLVDDGAAQALPARLLRRRARLLEDKLSDVRKRRLQIEVDKREQLRRELEAEMAAERARRKQVSIEVEDPGEADAVPASPAR